MNRKVFNVILFTVGAAVGSAVTWKVVRTKYEQIAQEEIDSVRAEYANLIQKMKEEPQDNTGDNEDSEDEDSNAENDEAEDETEYEIIHYHGIAKRYQSSDDEDDEEGGTGDADDSDYVVTGPYVITPEKFSSSPPGYSAQALDYYADGILADGWGVKLNIDDTIGEEALEEFGGYVDDVLYVRNDEKQIDYEVTRDPRTYAEAVTFNSNPYYGK